MKSLLVLMVVSGTVLAQTPAEHLTGEIKGTAVDHDGKPVSAATVFAVPQGLVLDDIKPRSVDTDRNGKFDFRGGFELRSYKLYTQKDADGYLSPFDAFYGDADSAVEVALSPKHPSSTVTVKLGKQAAVISGRVFDVDSNAPLAAYVRLMDEAGNGHSIVVDGDYNLVVPSEKNIHLMVTVIGTRRPIVPVSSLWLEPGQRVFMDIPISAGEK